jgi:hypothetical protein
MVNNWHLWIEGDAVKDRDRYCVLCKYSQCHFCQEDEIPEDLEIQHIIFCKFCLLTIQSLSKLG